MELPAKVVLVLALAIGSFSTGVWYNKRNQIATPENPGRRVLYYSCPMHPQYRGDHAGTAPCCGMRLEPVYEGGVVPAADGERHFLPGTLQLSPESQRLAGIRTATAEMQTGHRTLRTTGRVAADENRLYRLNASTELWIRKLHPATTGSVVRKDEPLLEFYSTNFLSAAAAYLYALNTRDRQAQSEASKTGQPQAPNYQVRQATEALQNLGVSALDIAEMEQTRQPRDLVTIRAPVDGVIISRSASMGQWIGSSTELYQIADLNHVWVYADIFENEARLVRPGVAVRVTGRSQGISLTARVSEAPPSFDAAARTMRVRLNADNPGGRLWPGMFVDVELPIQLPAAATVPSDAVINSGQRKTVYVAKGGGIFEARLVETGWQFGDRVEIVNGLATGEQVVVGGSFLLDSESRMKSLLSAAAPAVKDPVCGMEVDEVRANAGGRSSKYAGRGYYFCSDHCKSAFDKDPRQYSRDVARTGL